MSKLKAALFDLDGVVFDTEPQYSLFWGEQGRKYHPEIPNLEKEIKGQTLTQIFDRYFSGGLQAYQSVITADLNRFESCMSFEYVTGFEAFVKLLRANGIKTAVVTSSNRPKMESVYSKRPEFKTLFDRILTSEDFTGSKPDPDCYLTAAAGFGVAPDECLVFEDSFNGLKSGRAASMKVVGLSTTNSPEAIAPLSDMVVPDYTELSIERCEDLL